MLVAVDVAGLSYKEAADALGAPEGTVMSRLYRARKRVIGYGQASAGKVTAASRRAEWRVSRRASTLHARARRVVRR